jgi:hypothetical protein
MTLGWIATGLGAVIVISGLLIAVRGLMLLALLSILAKATVRIPALYAIYGSSGWLGIFGPSCPSA